MITIDELRKKIESVDYDIMQLQKNGGGNRAISALQTYKEYLQDELRMMEHAERSRKSII